MVGDESGSMVAIGGGVVVGGEGVGVAAWRWGRVQSEEHKSPITYAYLLFFFNHLCQMDLMHIYKKYILRPHQSSVI